MTENEAKAKKWMENIRDDAVITLRHIKNNLFYKRQKEKAEAIIKCFEELEQYRAGKLQTGILINYIINKIHSCPFEDECGVNFEKECVGFGEAGCKECILRNIDKLEV